MNTNPFHRRDYFTEWNDGCLEQILLVAMETKELPLFRGGGGGDCPHATIWTVGFGLLFVSVNTTGNQKAKEKVNSTCFAVSISL